MPKGRTIGKRRRSARAVELGAIKTRETRVATGRESARDRVPEALRAPDHRVPEHRDVPAQGHTRTDVPEVTRGNTVVRSRQVTADRDRGRALVLIPAVELAVVREIADIIASDNSDRTTIAELITSRDFKDSTIRIIGVAAEEAISKIAIVSTTISSNSTTTIDLAIVEASIIEEAAAAEEVEETTVNEADVETIAGVDVSFTTIKEAFAIFATEETSVIDATTPAIDTATGAIHPIL